ncbi:MAG TPA: DMT family transporter [Terriglobales bacterium]|jgi:transporter family-2 protein|nr:DMT family transporter [Terriglobales bacterium]
MNASWIIPFIILGGALQSCGAAMNGQFNKYIMNPWLASAVSFALTTFFFAGATLIMPHPLPTSKDLASLPWWAVIGGLVGAVQVYAGLTLVTKVGAGPFVGLTVTAALIMSLVIDHFGWFRMAYHPLNI